MDNPLFFLVIGVVFGFICYTMAESRNRNAPLWGVLGFLFGLIPLIILAIIGKRD